MTLKTRYFSYALLVIFTVVISTILIATHFGVFSKTRSLSVVTEPAGVEIHTSEVIAQTATPIAISSQYVLFYFDGINAYSYTLGSAFPQIVPVVSTITSYWSVSISTDKRFITIQWSDSNHAFLMANAFTSNGTGAVYRITNDQVTPERIALGDSSEPIYISSAGWAPDGQNIALVVNGTVEPGRVDHYIAIRTPDGKLHNVIHPDVKDASGQPTMIYDPDNDSHQEGVVRRPVWSPDGKYLAFLMSYIDRSSIMTPIPGTNQILEGIYERFIDTSCFIDFNKPCTITKMSNLVTSEYWFDFS